MRGRLSSTPNLVLVKAAAVCIEHSKPRRILVDPAKLFENIASFTWLQDVRRSIKGQGTFDDRVP